MSAKEDSPEVPSPEEEVEEVEEQKPKKSSGFGLFKSKPKDDGDSKPRFSMFARKVTPPATPQEEEEGSAAEPEKTEQELADEMADAEVQEIEEGEEEDDVTWEDRMRNVLRGCGVDTIEDDDDWKQMVIKTRLMLKDIKDTYLNNKGTKEERTKKLIVVINDDNVLEIQFRLDFIHTTPQNEKPDSDPDEKEIEPDLSITRSQKLNKKREIRLEEKYRIRAENERIRKEEEHRLREEKRLGLRREKAREQEEELTEEQKAEREEREKGREERERVRKEKKKAWMAEHKLRKKGRALARGDEWVSSEEEVEDDGEDRSILGQIEDETGVRIVFKTDKLEARLQEYKEIFFGPDLTEEELAELEKIANDDKTFYIHLKFIVRKKTWEEIEEERRLKEEEEARKRAEEEAANGEGGGEEEGELDETEERKMEKRKELAEKGGEVEEEGSEIEYDQVPM
eukprot:sb/3479419/